MLRNKLKELKKNIDNRERNAKLAQSAKVVQDAVDLLQNNGEAFIVAQLEAGNNTKVCRLFNFSSQYFIFFLNFTFS